MYEILLPFYYNAILNVSGVFTKCTVLWRLSYAVIAVHPSVEWWLLRLASWACGMCSHTGSHTWKGLLFDLCSAFTFWNSLNKVPHFPFALDLASYVVDPGNLCTFAFSTCIGSIVFRLYNDPGTSRYSENLWFSPDTWLIIDWTNVLCTVFTWLRPPRVSTLLTEHQELWKN